MVTQEHTDRDHFLDRDEIGLLARMLLKAHRKETMSPNRNAESET